MIKTIFEIFKSLFVGMLFLLLIAGIASIVKDDVNLIEDDFNFKNIFEHNAVGKWQTDEHSDLLIFNDNTAIYGADPCKWSKKSDNFIVLNCKYSGVDFSMTFETTSSTQRGTLIKGWNERLYQKVKANF